MDKIYAGLAASFVGFFIFFCVAYYYGVLARKRIQRRESTELELQQLFHKWCNARHKRVRWKEDRAAFFDFDHPEYQRMWMVEIGAEDVWFMKLPENQSWLKISWRGYCEERARYEKAD